MPAPHIEGAQFVRFLGPTLDALRSLGGSGRAAEVVDRVARNLGISDEIQSEMLPSGRAPRFANQVHWARFYLVREGFLDSSRRGIWSLTPLGSETRLSPEESRAIFLKWVKIDQERRKEQDEGPAPPVLSAEQEASTPLMPEDSPQSVLDIMKALPASGFERLCQRILREAGFSQVIVTGKSNDGGIDGHGTLEVNPLVSFKVLFQCKRYRDTVSPSVVRDFRGAMAGRADKGIILTTGAFSAEARKEATRDGVQPIELIDGEKLVGLLESLELGLRPRTVYEVDEAFFAQFVRGDA